MLIPYILHQTVRIIYHNRENHKCININVKDRKGMSQSNKKFKNKKKNSTSTNHLFANFKKNKNTSNSERKLRNFPNSKINSRQKSENVFFKIENLNLNTISKTKNDLIDNKENININLYNNFNENEKEEKLEKEKKEKEEEKKKEKEKQHYIEIIKEKEQEISKLKNELERLKKISSKKNNIKNITMISMRPNYFRQEDKKNSFEINKSATIDKLSRITNKSPNQNSFLKGNSTLSSSCYSHRIAYFSPKGKNNYPYNNRNIDTSIGNKNSIDADISNYKCEVKEILDKILEKTKKIFGKISKVNKL